MHISKRDFLALSAATGASMALPAWAQGKPMFDTLNMFVPAAPGGGWDGTARAIERAAKAAGLVGNMAFENVGGAGGMVGLPRFVNQRKGQGNILMVGGSVMIGAGIANKSPITIKNVTPIARLTEEAGVIVVPAAGKIKTWKELESRHQSQPQSRLGGRWQCRRHRPLDPGHADQGTGQKPTRSRLCGLCRWRPRQRSDLGQPSGGGHFGLLRV